MAAGLVLTACGRGIEPAPEAVPTLTAEATAAPESSPAPTSEPERELSGNLVLWHSWQGEDLKLLRSILDRLRADHPDLYLETVHVNPSEVPERLLNAILAGNGPSLLLAPIARYPELAATNLVQPLNGYMDLVQEGDLLPSALFGNIVDSSLVALPVWVETITLYVNTDLMAADEVPGTLDDLLTRANGSDHPLLGLYISPFHLGWGFPAFGAVMLDAGYRVVLDQQPGAEAWLTWLREANRSDGIWLSQDYAELQHAFRHGELPMIIDGSWAVDTLVTALGDRLRALPIPAGPAGPARPFVTTESLFVVAGLSGQDTDASVMAALAIVELAAETGHTTRGLPAAQRATETGPQAVRDFRGLLEHTAPMYAGADAKAIWDLAQTMFEHALAGRATPVELIARFTLLANEQTGR